MGTASPTCDAAAGITKHLQTLLAVLGVTLMMVVAMRKLKILAVLSAFSVLTPLVAQQYGRPQDGFSSGQYSGQYWGQYNGRVDGRVSRNEGLPPSAADKDNRTFDNAIDPGDCAEVDMLKPDARPGWQARVRNACQ